MKIRTTIVVDREDGTAPVKHEIWCDLGPAEVEEFQYPKLHPFAEHDTFALIEHTRRLERHQRFVDMTSTHIAVALGRALGDKSDNG